MNLETLVRLALEEDVGPGDVTTAACVDPERRGHARVIARQALVVCGNEPVAEVFRQVGARWRSTLADGAAASSGELIGEVDGPLTALLTGERTALNFLMRLSGIATHTRSVVAVAGGLRVLDTRKTTPLHRALERHAVACGGGHNHRFGLFDGVLIKDNHIVAAGGVTAAIERARAGAHHLLRVECEVENLAELEEALAAGADVILLDNMDDTKLAEAVRINAGRARLEASGNMNRDRIAGLVGMALDQVSMGGLVHQAPWADCSMRIEEAK